MLNAFVYSLWHQIKRPYSKEFQINKVILHHKERNLNYIRFLQKSSDLLGAQVECIYKARFKASVGKLHFDYNCSLQIFYNSNCAPVVFQQPFVSNIITSNLDVDSKWLLQRRLRR